MRRPARAGAKDKDEQKELAPSKRKTDKTSPSPAAAVTAAARGPPRALALSPPRGAKKTPSPQPAVSPETQSRVARREQLAELATDLRLRQAKERKQLQRAAEAAAAAEREARSTRISIGVSACGGQKAADAGDEYDDDDFEPRTPPAPDHEPLISPDVHVRAPPPPGCGRGRGT